MLSDLLSFFPVFTLSIRLQQNKMSTEFGDSLFLKSRDFSYFCGEFNIVRKCQQKNK